MPDKDNPGFLLRLPLFLLIWGFSALSMLIPAAHALTQDNHAVSRSFFYAGILGFVAITLIALAVGGRASRHSPISQLLSLLAAFVILPVFLALVLETRERFRLGRQPT